MKTAIGPKENKQVGDGYRLRPVVNHASRSEVRHKEKDDMKKMYMNPETGSVDDYDGWNYKTEDGQSVNAVDLGEVVEVEKTEDGDWAEVE